MVLWSAGGSRASQEEERIIAKIEEIENKQTERNNNNCVQDEPIVSPLTGYVGLVLKSTWLSTTHLLFSPFSFSLHSSLPAFEFVLAFIKLERIDNKSFWTSQNIRNDLCSI